MCQVSVMLKHLTKPLTTDNIADNQWQIMDQGAHQQFTECIYSALMLN